MKKFLLTVIAAIFATSMAFAADEAAKEKEQPAKDKAVKSEAKDKTAKKKDAKDKTKKKKDAKGATKEKEAEKTK